MSDYPARIAHYRVEGIIDRGSMGVVLRAQDARLGRTVAIKALPPEFGSDPRRRARLEREARLLALVSHPGIAAIFALEESEGRSYLILEYVPGEPQPGLMSRAG